MYYLFEDKAINCNTDYIISLASASQRPLARYRAKENALKKKTSESGAACNSTNTEHFKWLMVDIIKHIFHVTLKLSGKEHTTVIGIFHPELNFNWSHKTLPNWWKFANLGEFWQTIVDKFAWRKTALVQSNSYHLKIYHSTSAFIIWLLKACMIRHCKHRIIWHSMKHKSSFTFTCC